MRVKFWGVRGSIAAPLTPDRVRSKISAVVQRISPEDLESQDTREKFLASLPEWLFGTVGSNTSCVEVETEDGEHIIFDSGSGLRELGIDLMKRPGYENGNTYHLFLSHFHWDHIQGLPFFNPAYDSRNKIIVYSPRKKLKEFLERQMTQPYFPIKMLGKGGFGAKFEFRVIGQDERYFDVGKVKMSWNRVHHPCGCVAYSIIENGKKLIFSTDTELRRRDFVRTERNLEFYTNADLFIIDAQYTLNESIQKEGWGHSTFSTVVDFASSWNIKKIVLFHHEPTYSDRKIFSIKKNAEWYMHRTCEKPMEIFVAQEGAVYSL